MTHHPFAQIALNGNPKSQKNRPRSPRFLRNRLLHSPPFARRLNARAILHGRLGIGTHGGPPRQPLFASLLRVSMHHHAVHHHAAPATHTRTTLPVHQALGPAALITPMLSH